MGAVRHAFRFRKPQRIRSSREFASLKASGKRGFSRTMIMNWRLASDRDFSRLGIVVSKRIGKAVIRSRVRRLIREVFRNSQSRFLVSLDVVLVARKMIADASQESIRRDLMGLLRRAKVLKTLL